MKHNNILAISLIFLLIAGCTWQKIPKPPTYVSEQTIPLRVGIVASPNATSKLYVPGVVVELKAMRLFNSIIYPYHEGDVVDTVATIGVEGEWMPSGAGPSLTVALTLGLASPFVGPSVTGTHIIKATMISGQQDVGYYSSKITTTAEWGVMADAKEASEKTNRLQTQRLAETLATSIREDQRNLLTRVQSSQEELVLAKDTPPPRKSERRAASMPTPQASLAPVIPEAKPLGLKQGLFSFEAEKLAMQKGCTTATNIRPVALLVEETNGIGFYEVDCLQGGMSISCEYQNCELDRK